MPTSSPFLQSSFRSGANSLAIVHLSRDNLVPVLLQDGAAATDGYAEGAVLNSRFGSFPHSTLIDVPWGSQVRASTVDTGSRGRKRKAAAAASAAVSSARASPDVDSSELKRKREDSKTIDPKRQKGEVGEAMLSGESPCDQQSASQTPTTNPVQPAVTASSGFVHILKPSPELWTVSLPHRTQVVYTPDYSYVLQRLRALPGKTVIEAGAGSGSFTHAAARAVYNGFSSAADDEGGKVYSFEFHPQRFEQMRHEISEHGLDGIVQITHRNVYDDGFSVVGKSPKANAIFLDLPAPWEALHHLSRQPPTQNGSDKSTNGAESWVSPLDPERSVHICTFSPCIEQVTRTIDKMRDLGWVNIEMVEVAHKKLHITRDRIGINVPSERGTTQAPGDVMEAVARLKSINARAQEYHAKDGRVASDADVQMDAEQASDVDGQVTPAASAKPWKEGRLVHRADSELKTHTSYLVFAVLPREWSEEQEAEALARWPLGNETGVIGTLDKATRKNLKREQMNNGKKKKNKAKDR